MLEKIKEILSIKQETISQDTARSLIDIIDAPEPLIQWLSQVGSNTIEIPWTAELLRIYSAKDFQEKQKTYFIENQKNKNWNKDWIVIGDIISNPIILEKSSLKSKIFFSFHGSGNWNLALLAPSLENFCEALNIWCKLFLVKYDRDIYEDDFSLKSSFLSDLQNSLNQILPVSCVEVFLTAVD
ncbi:hypothetical protein [Lampropedia aestuarii]|uniref:hypothetical protein n=1 Tax=Lampropedia aestuarii TaxID=2562762 RepID=UPI0024693B63|nr:hypothetical protein [Lampropedia aestuarii]MDH5859276.1 hypothetical protein [Lampropedia aestuarii]